MYKQKNKKRSKKSTSIFYWLKRKITLMITAIMLGMSNGMYEEDKTIDGNQNNIEQEYKKD